MKISGHTRPFAVLGHPIGHTLSPVMHNAAFQSLDMDAIYLAFNVPPERLLAVLPAMADMGFGGVNLTVPLKEVAFRGLSDIDESARTLGAVNTVEFTGQGLRGHNTDGMGFLRAIEEAFGRAVDGLNLFLVGCGGAGRAVAITGALRGVARLALADLELARCEKLAAEIAGRAPAAAVQVVGADPASWTRAAREADLVVQATPVGMRAGETSPVPAAGFRAGQMAFDLVYNLPETGFTQTATAAGARAVNGLGMLLHQGAAAFSIWTRREAPVAVMRAALEGALYGRSVQ